MWFTPQPSKDYELRPPFGWYTIKNDAGHYYFHNPQKNLNKNIEDVTPADANPHLEQNQEGGNTENEKSEPVVRTILAINEEEKSMTFAGNIPQGSFIRLMKGNFDKLIDAAYHAGNNALLNQSEKSKLALIVSCVGRKIVLGNRIEEELELAKNTLGASTTICGFYSYGEFSPTLNQISCELHNQTITITTLSED